MDFLLDEGMPVQLLAALDVIEHVFEHVHDLVWDGKPDATLFRDAADRGFDGLITVNVHQLTNKHEWEALKRSDLHHISVKQGRTVRGIKGTARVIASVVVAMPYVIEELEARDGQQIVEVQLLAARVRHESFGINKWAKRNQS